MGRVNSLTEFLRELEDAWEPGVNPELPIFIRVGVTEYYIAGVVKVNDEFFVEATSSFARTPTNGKAVEDGQVSSGTHKDGRDQLQGRESDTGNDTATNSTTSQGSTVRRARRRRS